MSERAPSVQKVAARSHEGARSFSLVLTSWGPPMGVVMALALSLLMRFPALTWPLNQQPYAPCCGHPDELKHYVISRSFAGRPHRVGYPPGLGYMTHLAQKAGLGRLATSLAPPSASGTELKKIRLVYTARLLSLLLSCAGVWLLYALSRKAGLSGWVAACAAGFLICSPLYLVYSIYGLADVPNAVLILAYVYAFVRWSERQGTGFLVAFGLLVGGALAVKLGVIIALPLALHVLVTSRRRGVDAALLGLGTMAGAYVMSGGVPTLAELGAITARVDTVTTGVETSLPWNVVHHLGSLITGMGGLFVLVLITSLPGWGSWVRDLRRADWRTTFASPWSALAAGCVLNFAVICWSSSAHTRHMLVLYPFVVLFAMAGISRLRWARRLLDAPPERSVARVNLAGAAAMALIAAYGSVTARPVLGSFSDDPNVRAARWLREQTDADDRVQFARYTERARLLFDMTSRRPGDGRTRELLVIHSYWSGRFTGTWWLKPAPKTLKEVKQPGTEDAGVLDVWQALMEGRLTNLKIVASFGDDWRTPERALLHAVGRGYDQFVTAGEVSILEREPDSR